MFQIWPKAVWLTVNRNCNFRCKWCYAEGTSYSKENEMSLELAEKLADIAYQMGITKILLIGGEPTLWEPLLKFNKFCAEKSLQTILVTNGAQFAVDKFWQEYRKNPNDKIALSLKASTAQQLFKVAGVSNFELVKKGIIRAIQELDAQASITYNIFYTENLIDMVKFAMECGAKGVKIDFCSTVFVRGHPESTYMVDPKVIVKNIVRDYPELTRLTDENIVFEMMIPFCLWPIKFLEQLKERQQILSVCHVHKREGIIFDENARVLMCNALFDYPIGRYGDEFNNGESLLTWLNSPKILSYYDYIRHYPSEMCEKCDWYVDCGGGCPLRWAVYDPKKIVRPIKKSILSSKGGNYYDRNSFESIESLRDPT